MGMEEYLDVFNLYSQHRKKQTKDLILDESANKLTISKEGENILEIELPQYYNITKNIDILKAEQKKLETYLLNYSKLSKDEFIHNQQLYRTNKEELENLEKTMNDLNDYDSQNRNKIELLNQKDILEEELRQLYNNLKSIQHNSPEWKVNAIQYLGNKSDPENIRTKLNKVIKELTIFSQKDLYIDNEKKFYPNDPNHPLCYVSDVEKLPIDYKVSKLPIIKKKGLNPVVNTKMKIKKIKIKTNNDCRTNLDKCIEMSKEKGKEMICNENTGKCIIKP